LKLSPEIERSPKEAEKQDQVLMHSSGFLELRQNLLPLNKAIEKMGNSRMEGATRFLISDFKFGEGDPVDSKTQKPLMDHFSRGQFEDLPDSEKLSTPDFDLMLAGIEIAPAQAYDISPNIQFTANNFEDFILGETETIKQDSSFNWQENRLMNLTGGRKLIDVARPEELYGVVEETPVQKERTYKILSKEALESPERLKEKYFNNYSGAKDYLQTKWPKEEQGAWQFLQADTEENEEVVLL
jgi:hypothetical protein